MITLTRPHIKNTNQPQFLEATILPSVGMNLLQVKAFIPDKGIINLLHSPNFTEAEKQLESENNFFGNKALTMGVPILLPFANRIRGTLDNDGQSINTMINGHRINLPANWCSEAPHCEKHAIHGLIYNRPFTHIHTKNSNEEAAVFGELAAGDFKGHWLSKTDVRVAIAMSNNIIELKITAKNSGNEELPMGIGAHPYFALPSEQRHQVQLHLPATMRALVNNYADVFPTGKVETVNNTAYDFSASPGKNLANLYLDDSFTQLIRDKQNRATATIIDPLANYGLHIHIISPEIKVIQVYSPPEKNFIAIEPQFNLVDPYNSAWGNTDTGMVRLQPGESKTWQCRFELFDPAQS